MSENKQNSVVLSDHQGVYFSVYRMPLPSAEAVMEPAEELIHYLERSLGFSIPQHNPQYPVSLVLKLDVCLDIEREGFIIEANENTVQLVARTRAGMSHAVYYFLETVVGVRWLWPGDDGEVVPVHRSLIVKQGRSIHKPDYTWRALQTRGAIYGQAGGIDLLTTQRVILNLPCSYQKDFDRWAKRNRFGGENIADGHRWSEIAPPDVYGRTDPDIYALINGERDTTNHDGKHGNQPCLSNPRVADMMAEYACAQFEADPSLDAFSIAINDNDGNGMCQCQQCIDLTHRKTEESYLDQITNEFNQTGRSVGLESISELVYHNANTVIQKVRLRYPNKKVLVLLYDAAREAPNAVSLDPSVIGQLCIMGSTFWNPEIRKSELEILDSLKGVVPSMGIYEYYANGAWPDIHRCFPELISESLNLYYDHGARYFATQPSMGFATNGLNYYVLGRLLWDRSLSVEQIIEDYCQKGFGAASEHIQNYFASFSHRWKETHSATSLPDTVESRLSLVALYSETFLKDRKLDLEKALECTAQDYEVTRRIKFLLQGLQYTMRYRSALASTLATYDACADNHELEEYASDQIVGKPQEHERVAHMAKSAIETWRIYWEFVKDNAGQFIIGEYWVNYRYGIGGKNDPLLRTLFKITHNKLVGSDINK